MIPYMILIGAPAFVTIMSRKIISSNKKTNIVISIFFFILIILLALRGTECGNDTMAYKKFFEASKSIDWENISELDMEYGYVIFEKICSSIFPSYQWFLAISTMLSVLPVWIYYRKESEIPFLSIVLFVTIAPFSMYFSGIRQILAMAFTIPAFYFARNRKLIFFLIMIALAFSLHKSAFILLLLYPMCHIKITKKWLWVVILAIGSVFVFNKQIFAFLLTLINDFYIGEVSSTGAYAVLVLLVIFAIYSYLLPNQSKIDDDISSMRNILLLSVCLQCFVPINPLAMRMNYYFLLFIPILVPKIALRSKIAYRKIAETSILVMMIFFTIYFFFNISRGGGLNIYPYIPFWR